MQAVARQCAQELLSRLEAQRADLAQSYTSLEANPARAWEEVERAFLKN